MARTEGIKAQANLLMAQAALIKVQLEQVVVTAQQAVTKGLENDAAIQEVHLTLNSKLTELIKAREGIAHAAGGDAGREAAGREAEIRRVAAAATAAAVEPADTMVA